MSSWLSYFFPAPAAPSAPANANETREAPAASLDEYSFADAKPLGSGADAQVVAATHIPTNKRIALKLIDKPKRRPDQLDRSRFESKLITSVFDHPNIVKGLPLVENEHLLVLPMELAPMGDLLDFVNSRHGFPEPEARDIFRQLVEGLAHAHSKNVLHGDIKLENVLIFPPSKEQVKRGDFRRRFAICDWGYARYNTGEPLKKAFGSMLYSSPEIITGTGHFSTATDIWGLGVILYALIYATLPFGGKDLRQHIAAAQFSFPPQVPVSPDCKALISAIMKINPAERLTIDQIRAHPWLTGSRAPVKPILASVPHSSSSCSPLASASSSGASSSSVSLSGTADSDCAASPAQPATQLSTVCVASAADPAAPAHRAPASKPPTNGCWYLDSGDEDLDAVVRQ